MPVTFEVVKKRFLFLFLTCTAAIAGVIVLQLAWLSNYYKLNKDRFDKEVNLAFEDAVKKEFALRCDTLEDLLYRYISDTNNMLIRSQWVERKSGYKRNNGYIYHIVNRRDTTDKASFSMKDLNLPIQSPGDSVARQVAKEYAGMYRHEDLERHIIYFITQDVGNYIGKKAYEYNFDTNRLRPVFTQYLAARNIHEPFWFYMRDSDSTFNQNKFPDSIQQQYPVITKSFATYKNISGENFVRAIFGPPRRYLLGRMMWMLAGSLILLFIVGFSLYYLVSVIRREKRLSVIKNDFINNISHELKTPVATVSAAIEAMENFNITGSPEKTKRYLDISKNELQRLADMVNKILNISIYEKQAYEIRPEMLNVDEMIAELTGNFSVSSRKKIEFTYSNNTGSSVIKADRLHFYNAVNNLIDNAVKYSGSEVKIEIVFYRQNGYTILAIQDNGPGISKQHLPFIFDKFYRVPSGNLYKVKGYGLGLSYVKSIMEKHSGWCTAESRPGAGSIFKLGFSV